MAIIATDSMRFSGVVNREYDPASGYCRDQITYNGTAVNTPVGTVLGKYIASPVGTAGAVVGTGNGVMGAITMTSTLGLELGTYVLRIVKAVTNAGDFELLNPAGRVVGMGQVATAFAQAGFSFTLADGATDFVVGDTISIEVTGTYKYKLLEATATDGSQVAAAIYIADQVGLSHPITPVVNTDTLMLAFTRGPVIVEKGGLSFGASVNTNALKAKVYAQLEAIGIRCETTV